MLDCLVCFFLMLGQGSWVFFEQIEDWEIRSWALVHDFNTSENFT